MDFLFSLKMCDLYCLLQPDYLHLTVVLSCIFTCGMFPAHLPPALPPGHRRPIPLLLRHLLCQHHLRGDDGARDPRTHLHLTSPQLTPGAHQVAGSNGERSMEQKKLLCFGSLLSLYVKVVDLLVLENNSLRHFKDTFFCQPFFSSS